MENETGQRLFKDCLSVELPLALGWRPGGQVDAMRQQRVLRQLQLVQGFEESRGDVVEEGASAQMEATLQRIEQKLDFTLELLGSLLAREGHALETIEAQLSTKGMRARLGEAARVSGVIEFKLHSLISEPLEIPARLIHVEADGQCYFRFEETGSSIASALERLVFRWHRRAIAATRKS